MTSEQPLADSMLSISSGRVDRVEDPRLERFGKTPALDTDTMENGKVTRTAVKTSYFKEAHFVRTFHVADEGDYRVVVERGVSSNFTYVPQTCTVTILVDGKELKQSVLQWHGANSSSEKQFSTFDTVSVHWTVLKVLVCVGTVGCGFAIYCALWVLTGCISFIAVDAQEVSNSFTYGSEFATEYPLQIFGRPLGLALTFVLPVACCAPMLTNVRS